MIGAGSTSSRRQKHPPTYLSKVKHCFNTPHAITQTYYPVAYPLVTFVPSGLHVAFPSGPGGQTDPQYVTLAYLARGTVDDGTRDRY